MSLESDVITTVQEKLKSYLDECSYGEANGVTFSGEAWAYRRVLNFINGLQEQHNQVPAAA